MILGLLIVLYQPWLTQWGSTGRERTAPMAGDELVTNPRANWTRSITIEAPPEDVWPWLEQMGGDKGGFYTYDWAEQLFGDPVHNTTRIHENWQNLRVGDRVSPFPTGKSWVVAELDEPRVLVVALQDGTWSWAIELHALPGERTRLVTRMRAQTGSALGYLLDPGDLIVFPRVLVGIKQRAEGTLPGMPGTHTGAPFPLARLPVHSWAALAWVSGLALFGFATARALGLGRWGERRRRAITTAVIAFVAGAGYMLMSDTPPVQFFNRRWGIGMLAAGLTGWLAGRVIQRTRPRLDPTRAWVGRGVAALAETGLFVLLPAIAVWQAATARGWTSTGLGFGAGAVVAAAVATAVATGAWRAGTLATRDRVVVAGMLSVAFVATGSGWAPLAGAVIAELLGGPTTNAGSARSSDCSEAVLGR